MSAIDAFAADADPFDPRLGFNAKAAPKKKRADQRPAPVPTNQPTPPENWGALGIGGGRNMTQTLRTQR